MTAGIELMKVIRYNMPATNDVFLVGSIGLFEFIKILPNNFEFFEDKKVYFFYHTIISSKNYYSS